MRFRGLRINIAIRLMIILGGAMLLTDMLIIFTLQRDLLRSESMSAIHYLRFVNHQMSHLFSASPTPGGQNHNELYDQLTDKSEVAAILMVDNKMTPLYKFYAPLTQSAPLVIKALNASIQNTVKTGRRNLAYHGFAWGVFFTRHRYLILAEPFQKAEGTPAAGGVVLKLDPLYQTLRHTQKVVFSYIFFHVILFTIISLIWLSKLTVAPIKKLVKRARTYKASDEMVFLYGQHDNEFSTLSKALNSMLARIQNDKKKLEKTVRSLETANADLKMAQKEVIRAEKLATVGRLSSGIAHEIGNPIGIVMGYLELIKADGISEDEKKEFILRTEMEVQRIDRIIRQLLDFSRPSEMKASAISLHAVLLDIAKICKVQPLFADIAVDLDLTPACDQVYADPDQLRQVFVNIMLNGADAIRAKGEDNGRIGIKTRVKEEDGAPQLCITFTDNGIGLNPSDVENMFDPFFTTKEAGQGTGLGLSVSFRMISGMNGTLSADSRPGEGMVLTVTLPVLTEDASGGPAGGQTFKKFDK